MWLLFTTPTLTTGPSEAERWSAISTRSTKRWRLPVPGFSLVASPHSSSARSLLAQPDGKVLVTDGPYLEAKEHIGGFWILEAANLDEAPAWGRKAVVACRTPQIVPKNAEGGETCHFSAI